MSEHEVRSELQNIRQNLETLQKQIEEQIKPLKEEYQKKAGAALYKLAEAIFDKHTQIVGLHWLQYTPYFNDGDACVFHVRCEGDVIINLNGVEYETVYGYFDDVPKELEETLESIHLEAKEDLRVFTNFIDNNEELMQELFGDHCKVIIRKGSKTVEVETYDHD